MSLDISAIRNQFPSLSRPAIFFYNPGGTQIAKQFGIRYSDYSSKQRVDDIKLGWNYEISGVRYQIRRKSQSLPSKMRV